MRYSALHFVLAFLALTFISSCGGSGAKESSSSGSKNFPEITLQINSGGGRNEMVAESIQKMLQQNLGINVNIQQVEFAQHYENLESGKARFWRAGWVADYADPENFLNLLYGNHVPDDLTTNSYVNSVRYQNPEFDKLFEQALATIDDDQRMELYRQADQVAMSDAAILPIYYNIYHRLLQPYVRDFPQNPMEYRLMESVYLVPDEANPYSGDLTKISGDKYRGGIFRYNETQYMRSLFPLNTSEVVGHRVVNQIYEGLVKLDQSDLSVLPSLAESWNISEDGLVYTFKIRKGVYYQDDACFEGGKGREVTAEDFLYCFTRLCTPDKANKGFSFVKERIKGAAEYYDALADGKVPEGGSGVEGLRVLDPYTFQVELNQPFSAILGIFSMPFCYIFPQEALEMYGEEMRIKTVGTGPFILKKAKENDNLVLVRNENYWGKDENGNQLPYLDGVNVRFISEEKSELLSFMNGEFEMKFRIPAEMYEQVVDRSSGERQLTPEYSQYILQYMPMMTVEYYGFLHPDPDNVFDNKLVRQAFCYAIDRQQICDYVTKGMADPAFYGIVPLAFSKSHQYDNRGVNGYDYDPDKARYLLEQAGYVVD
jgi:ABC-type transport system substrate-binding protein